MFSILRLKKIKKFYKNYETYVLHELIGVYDLNFYLFSNVRPNLKIKNCLIKKKFIKKYF